jgi:negative regulator of sigma E activity
VTTDGAGRFELRADDLITPTLDPNAEALFLLAQENRESLMFRHRDATVRDEALFLQNYTATDAGVVEQVLGRDCARWSVQANAGGNVWTLWIDLTTGVVLRWEELNAAQTLVARLEYLTFDDAPDTSQAVWHTNPLQETALDRVHPKSQLGFDPLQPKLLPAGFQLASAEHVVESVSGRTWARFTYTDGWAELVFMDGGPMTVPQTAQGYAPDASVMRIATVGSWVVADGRLGDRRVLSAARGSADQLQALVESAVQ